MDKKPDLVPYQTREFPNLVFWVTPKEKIGLLDGDLFIRRRQKDL